MSIQYETFTDAFLSKISEYDFVQMWEEDRTAIVDGYLKRAVVAFKKNCKYDLFSTADDGERAFVTDVAEEDIDELVDIISEGMLVQWLKPYVYKQELLENTLNTKDFTTYSPAELLMRVGNAYEKAQKDYKQMVRDYSFNHANLKELHL